MGSYKFTFTDKSSILIEVDKNKDIIEAGWKKCKDEEWKNRNYIQTIFASNDGMYRIDFLDGDFQILDIKKEINLMASSQEGSIIEIMKLNECVGCWYRHPSQKHHMGEGGCLEI